MSKQSRTPKQSAVGRWCTHRGCPAGAYLGTPLSACAATGWASVQPRAGESLFLPAQDPRQAMALLAGPGKAALPSPRWVPLCFCLPGVKLSGPAVYQIFPEKLACTRPCAVWGIRVWTSFFGLPNRGAGVGGCLGEMSGKAIQSPAPATVEN